jgi:hypothetical protein
MRRAVTVFVLALAGCFISTGTSQASAFRVGCLRLPVCLPAIPGGFCCHLPRLIHSCVARPVLVVQAPPVVVVPPMVVPPPMPPAPAQLPGQLPGPIVSQPAPAPVVVMPAPAVVMTHEQFARAFKPLPGRYEVTLLHPGSKCPVTVCFTLPDGCPRVEVRRREIVFDYGRHEVEIRFALFGKVKVNYR